MRKPRLLLVSSSVVAVIVAVAAAAAVAGDNDSGFHTTQPSMLTTGDRPDVTFRAIATVGDKLPGGTVFESIPDGIALRTRGQGRVDVYVNHETSTVPFPYTPAAPTEAELAERLPQRRGVHAGAQPAQRRGAHVEAV